MPRCGAWTRSPRPADARVSTSSWRGRQRLPAFFRARCRADRRWSRRYAPAWPARRTVLGASVCSTAAPTATSGIAPWRPFGRAFSATRGRSNGCRLRTRPGGLGAGLVPGQRRSSRSRDRQPLNRLLDRRWLLRGPPAHGATTRRRRGHGAGWGATSSALEDPRLSRCGALTADSTAWAPDRETVTATPAPSIGGSTS